MTGQSSGKILWKRSSSRPCGYFCWVTSVRRSVTWTTRTRQDGDPVSGPAPPERPCLAQDRRRRERLERQVVAAGGEHDLGVLALIRRRPAPDGGADAAVINGLLHRKPLVHRLLPGYDKIDIVRRAEAVLHRREEAVGVGGQVDAVRVPLLRQEVVDEARTLVREAVVVLAPGLRSQEVVQG